MARYRGPRLRIIRRLGTALPGLIRTDADLRRPYPPGQHGPNRRRKLSDYALRLAEKQKIRFHYGLSEKQLRRYVAKSARSKGNTGTNLMVALERRLDNVVFRSGYAPTIRAARQMVGHGHLTVNGSKVDIASYEVRSGDVVSIRETSKMKAHIVEARKDPMNLPQPEWLETQEKEEEVKMNMLPGRDTVPFELNEQLVVEYYSGR